METQMKLKEQIAQLTRIYSQTDSLNEEAGEIAKEIKASGHDSASAVALARAMAKGTVDKAVEKSESFLNTVQIARS